MEFAPTDSMLAHSADLHLHTRFSDGGWTPAELVQEAARLGFGTIAVTDHDTLDGISESLAAGKKTGIEVIAGVEITCNLDGTEAHLLGYFLGDTWQAPPLRAVLEHAKQLRLERIEQFVARLRQLGVPLTVADVMAGSDCGTTGRLHVALALQRRGLVANVGEAFARFLRRGRPAFVDRPRINLVEAIGHIEQAGGVAVLAHPGLLNRDNQIEELHTLGLAGLEVWHPGHSPIHTSRYLKTTERLGLLATGGSDSHGPMRDELVFGSVRILRERVEALKARIDDSAKARR
jgi:predicted metal-dependent phosphoesterase TrpH